ncbi:MAG: cytochrome c5 family protein [Burkholderiales bacterium]|jgi:cytochrome c5|nr:MAG: cytochrome c5 family protein [Burkholderiales bacterium]
MSQAPQSKESGHHEGPISTPKQLVAAVLAAFIIPVVIIVLLVNYVSSNNSAAPGSEALSAQAVSQRIMPVGTVEIKVASANAGPRGGEEVYKAQCTNCHAAGMLGAPKLGDAAAWGPRIAKGENLLLEHALKGFNSMPAQGGGEFSDVEVHRGLVYMANAGGAKFTEPAAPAAAASAAASAP